MKLYNRTRLPDKPLHGILAVAARAVGARSSGVVVTVSTAPWRGVSGLAWECSKIKLGGRWVKTDAGCFNISIPLRLDPLKTAENFFEVARHEWAHIRDFQDEADGLALYKWDNRKRRGPHDSRPEEIRAENRCYDADQRGLTTARYGEQILALAIAIETAQKEKRK